MFHKGLSCLAGLTAMVLLAIPAHAVKPVWHAADVATQTSGGTSRLVFGIAIVFIGVVCFCVGIVVIRQWLAIRKAEALGGNTFRLLW
jgi:succinate dehydrogenase hydrophobic anchor subunit